MHIPAAVGAWTHVHQCPWTLSINSGDQSWNMLKVLWKSDYICLRNWDVSPGITKCDKHQTNKHTPLKFNLEKQPPPLPHFGPFMYFDITATVTTHLVTGASRAMSLFTPGARDLKLLNMNLTTGKPLSRAICNTKYSTRVRGHNDKVEGKYNHDQLHHVPELLLLVAQHDLHHGIWRGGAVQGTSLIYWNIHTQ